MEHQSPPHVVAIPFPAEGHIKPMLSLSKLLSLHGGGGEGGLKVTFVNTHHNHARFHLFTHLSSFHAHFPNLHFASITDGVPQDHPRLGLADFAAQMISPSTRSTVTSDFRELMTRLFHQKNAPSCIVADGMMSTIVTCVTEEFGVPLIVFRTYSATCTWVTIHLCKLIHEGVVLHQDDMNELVATIPGLETVLRLMESWFSAMEAGPSSEKEN